ncbi:mannitol dehydrogenase family protein [Tessaracoccus sp.]
MTPRLSRRSDQPPAPVRIIHLGLGNFFRAHQAWYTANAPDAKEWGIAAFTGRRPDAAQALAPQEGLYTLMVRGRDGDTFEVIDSVSKVHTSTDHTALLDYFRDSKVSIVTLTVTEAGYVRNSDGGLDLDDDVVAADVGALQADPTAAVVSTPAKLVAGLLARQAADCGPITILPCDNLPGNGAVVERVVRDLAAVVDPDLLPWLDHTVDFATSMVDRITPASTDADRRTVREELGFDDASPVPTEPFSEWVISGEFPAGRPQWEKAGVKLVDDVEVHEKRKLLLLNGSHSLLAYGASILGHTTVADAINDDRCRAWVEQWWDDARPSIDLPDQEIADYRAALVSRYENPRIRHLLAQIASDGSQKIPVRIVPAIQTERAAGRLPAGAIRALAAWVAHLRGLGAPVKDPAGQSWQQSAGGEPTVAVQAVLERLGLGGDDELASAVVGALAEFESVTTDEPLR